MPCPLQGFVKVRLVFKSEGRRALWLLLLRLPWRGQVTGSVQIPDVSKIKLTEEWVDQDGNQVGFVHDVMMRGSF